MPYIKEGDRIGFTRQIEVLAVHIETLGELNFVITKLLLEFAENNREENYGLYCALMGTLESVKQEFYRRKVAPYEDEKRKQNGDVFQSRCNPSR